MVKKKIHLCLMCVIMMMLAGCSFMDNLFPRIDIVGCVTAALDVGIKGEKQQEYQA